MICDLCIAARDAGSPMKIPPMGAGVIVVSGGVLPTGAIVVVPLEGKEQNMKRHQTSGSGSIILFIMA